MGSPAGFSKESEHKDKAPCSPPLSQLELLAGVGGRVPDTQLVVRRSEWRKEPIPSLGGWPRVPILQLPVPPVGDTPEADRGVLGQDTLLLGP